MLAERVVEPYPDHGRPPPNPGDPMRETLQGSGGSCERSGSPGSGGGLIPSRMVSLLSHSAPPLSARPSYLIAGRGSRGLLHGCPFAGGLGPRCERPPRQERASPPALLLERVRRVARTGHSGLAPHARRSVRRAQLANVRPSARASVTIAFFCAGDTGTPRTHVFLAFRFIPRILQDSAKMSRDFA